MNLGGSTKVGVVYEAKTNKGIQNLANVKLQRNTGLFITFLQELTDLLGSKAVLALVAKETQEAMKELDEAFDLAAAQAAYQARYLAELDAIENKIIKPYDAIWNKLEGIEVEHNSTFNTIFARSDITIKDFATLKPFLEVETSIEGTSGLLTYLQGDINKRIAVNTPNLGIYTGKEQSVLEYYGLTWESYTTTINFSNQDREVTRYRIKKEDSGSSSAHAAIQANLKAAQGIIKTTTVTVPSKNSETNLTISDTTEGRNANLIQTLDKFKDTPKEILKFFLLGTNSGKNFPGIANYLNTFNYGDADTAPQLNWILTNKVSF